MSPFFQTLGRVRSRVLHVLDFAAPLAPLLTRFVIGFAFFVAGRGKLNNLDSVTMFFTDLGIPMPYANAVFVSALECFGGLLLMAGLATRVIAALLGATMVVALLTADRAAFVTAFGDAVKFSGENSLTDVPPVVYGLFLLWLIVVGPGRLSADALLTCRCGLDISADTAENGSCPVPVRTSSNGLA